MPDYNDSQRRLVNDYLFAIYKHNDAAFKRLNGHTKPNVDLAYAATERTVVDELTDARNKLTLCIAILDDRTPTARPSSGGPAVDH